MHKRIFFLLGLAALIIVWLFWQQARAPKFIVSGFIEADQIRVGSQVGGRVAEVFAEEGDRVQRGEVLFRLEPFDLEAVSKKAGSNLAAAQAEYARLTAGFRAEEVQQAQARRERARAILEKAVTGPRPQEITIAREQVRSARAASKLAAAEFVRLEALVTKDQVSKEAYDEAVRAREAAQAELAIAEHSLALLEEGTRKEDIAAAKAGFSEAEQALALMREGYRKEDVDAAAARLASAEAELEAVQARIDELDVLSPCDCILETIELEPGDLVSANAPAVSLLDSDRLWVRTYIPEARLGHLQIGRIVPVRVDGIKDVLFNARISYIAQEGEFVPRNIQTPEERSKQVFRTKLILQEGLGRLRAGMAVDVLFEEASGP